VGSSTLNRKFRGPARGQIKKKRIFSGSKIREIARDGALDEIVNEVEGTVGQHFKSGLKFLLKRKGENYGHLLRNSIPTK
jgi:hypothetical protein